MTELSYFSAFLVGLAGAVHCVGMCGGVVAAMNIAIPKHKPHMAYIFNYNLGRILSYTLAGALAGGLGNSALASLGMSPKWLAGLSAVFLILLACHIGQWLNWLSYLEKWGGRLWKKVSPLSKRFIPFKHPSYALPYGMIWGWLPCGLVYSALTWSLASGSVIDGALLMLSFGLGTFPALITLGITSVNAKQWLQNPIVRKSMAILLLIFGLYSLLKIF